MKALEHLRVGGSESAVRTDWPAPRLLNESLDGGYRAGEAGSIPEPGMLRQPKGANCREAD